MGAGRRAALTAIWALSVVIVGSVINVITSLIAVPDGAEWYVVSGGLAILAIAGFFEHRRVQQEEQQRIEASLQEREHQRAEREAERARERAEREAEERARKAAVQPVPVPTLGYSHVKSYLSKTPPQVTRLETALREVTDELKAACVQFAVEWKNSLTKAGVALAAKSNDDRWITVGDNVKRLLEAGSVSPAFNLIGVIPGTAGAKLAPIPTDESLQSFVDTAATIRWQIRTLRYA
jgi:hypothetical protein